jgi:Icc-related predicted phosphoesterase
MKTLALGDPHGKLPKNLDSIIIKNKIELIICVGDHGDTPKIPWLKKEWEKFEKQGRIVEKSTEEILKKLCSYKIPVITLQGNMMLSKESTKIMRKIYKKHKNIKHKKTGKIKIKGKTFIMFDVLWEEESKNKESEISDKKLIGKKMQSNIKRENKLNKLLRENPNSILITHNPPYGKVDIAYNKKHVGSKIITNAIKKHQPKLVLCGHIHEAKGKAKINKTQIINLGSHGDYQILEI